MKMRAKCLLIGEVVMMVYLLSFGWAAAEEIENMAMGGDFEDASDMNKWTLNLFQSAATMSVDLDTAATGEASLFVDITQGSGWDPRPYQSGHLVKKGRTYTLSAHLKAEENRQISLRIHEPGPWTLAFQKQVTVGTDWQEYWVTSTVQTELPVEITFCNNGATVNYWVDNVRFYEGEYVPTDIPGAQKRVAAMGKLSTTWGQLKMEYNDYDG